MNSNDKTNRLIQVLRDLYIKISAFAVHRRICGYHNNTTPGFILDISEPLARQLDKLAAETKQRVATLPDAQSEQLIPDTHNSNKPELQSGLVSKIADGFCLDVKLSARKKETDQYMSEKLKASTWSHLHLAFMKARNGEADAAKLHAGIASQALKEAAHYLNDDDYKFLCSEVEKAVKEVKETNT